MITVSPNLIIFQKLQRKTCERHHSGGECKYTMANKSKTHHPIETTSQKVFLQAKESLTEALAQQVRKHCRCKVQRHLLESECQTKEHASKNILIYQEAVDSPDHQTQHHRVVLEMSIVDQDETRLQKNQDQSRVFACPGLIREPNVGEADDRGKVDEEFKDQDCGAHVEFGFWRFVTARSFPFKPIGIDLIATK